MEVHYHNRQQLPASEEGGAKFHKDLKSLLSVSDFLSLHCPSKTGGGWLGLLSTRARWKPGVQRAQEYIHAPAHR